MVIPTSKPTGRTLADFGQLGPAEQKLLEASRIGALAIISEQRPEPAKVMPTRQVYWPGKKP